MIREIINFTKSLSEDMKGVLDEYLRPTQEGVFILVHRDGSFSFETYQQGNDMTAFLQDCALKMMKAWTVEYDSKPYYQKCFDLPNKRIHSVSPFLVALKRQYLEGGKEFDTKRVDNEYVQRYLGKAKLETIIDDEKLSDLADKFSEILKKEFSNIVNGAISKCLDPKIGDNQYVLVFFDVPLECFSRSYDNYLKLKLFNSSKKGLTDTNGNALDELDAQKLDELRGWSNFYCSYNDDKFFFKHKTGITSVNTITNVDARLLNDFKEYIRMGIFPSLLPIFLDKNELKNGGLQSKYIKIFNEGVCHGKKMKFREIVQELFKTSQTTLQKYYLLYTQTGKIMDFDYVSSFDYYINNGNGIDIDNITGINYSREKINTILDLESILNRYFQKYSKNTKQGTGFLIGHYFTSVDEYKDLEKYVIGDGYQVDYSIWTMFFKYRKAIYNYVYKSKKQALTTCMFDEIVYTSIAADISVDIKHDKRYEICRKINEWFSLCDIFDNNNKTNNMTSKVKELKDKVRAIANGEANISSPEEFAFAAGQLVSYLFDRSAASDKDYSMLEPYLQKAKSCQLQDAIAHTITIYKHDIKICKGKFENLASNVLAEGTNVEMKPLLKFFLAGCFSDCVIYEKKDNNE